MKHNYWVAYEDKIIERHRSQCGQYDYKAIAKELHEAGFQRTRLAIFMRTHRLRIKQTRL